MDQATAVSLTPAQVDVCFDAILRRQHPKDALERLERLEALHFGLAYYNDACLVWGARNYGAELKAQIRARRDKHSTAARSVRRRIGRLMRRGVL